MIISRESAGNDKVASGTERLGQPSMSFDSGNGNLFAFRGTIQWYICLHKHQPAFLHVVGLFFTMEWSVMKATFNRNLYRDFPGIDSKDDTPP